MYDQVKKDAPKGVASKYVLGGLHHLKNGRTGAVQLDKKGKVIASVQGKKIKDSFEIDTLGSIGKGGGSSLIREAIDISHKFGKKGQITLYSSSDIAAINFYLKSGFDTKPGQNDGRLLFLDEKYSNWFAKRYDERHDLKVNKEDSLEDQFNIDFDIAMDMDEKGQIIIIAGEIDDIIFEEYQDEKE